jgi:hypothetical protein
VAELTRAAAFDTRLERVLTAYGDTAVKPVDALAIADRAVLLDRRRANHRSWTWLAAAAVVTLLALLALAALGGGGRSLLNWLATGPLPSTPGPTATVGVATANPQGQWMGSPRTIGVFQPSAGTYLAIDDARLCVGGRSYSQGCLVLQSAATVPTGGELRLTAQAGGLGCAPGQVGTYRFRLSPGGGRLTIESIADECAARIDGVVGTWFRSDCRNVSDACLGLLEGGTYQSQFLHARGPAGTYPASDFGAVQYTVPPDWANSGDWPVLLSLTPAADYANEGRDGALVGHYQELDLLAHPLAAAQGTACDGSTVDLADATPAGFEAWLSGQSAFSVANQGRATVAGLPARVVDVRLAPGYAGVCPGETEPSADYLVLRDDPGRGFTPRLRGAEVQRLILVDLGAGELLTIMIDSSDPARFDDLVAASMPIVNSLVIR